MILRRRRLPEHLQEPLRAFEALVPELQRAKAALIESVPGTRLPGRPLAETLAEFEERLRAVADGMSCWRAPGLEEVWRASSRGLGEALELAERVRTGAQEPGGFEGLIGLVEELLAPLEPFSDVANRFRELRAARYHRSVRGPGRT